MPPRRTAEAFSCRTPEPAPREEAADRELDDRRASTPHGGGHGDSKALMGNALGCPTWLPGCGQRPEYASAPFQAGGRPGRGEGRISARAPEDRTAPEPITK